MKTLIIIYVFVTLKCVHCALEPFITGGSFARYNQYPHAAFLNMNCKERFVCGGSIVTQNIILTAAHCLEGCEGVRPKDVEIKYGHEDIRNMKTTFLRAYIQHERYDEKRVMNDIGLLLVKDKIQLNKFVKRVILMKYPPKVPYGYISGWGNDENGLTKSVLKHTNAKIQTLNVCSRMGFLPTGTFCAGPVTGIGAANEGDSGGALVVNDYVQIGLVSFKVERYSLVAYTNVSYFLSWIKRNSKQMYCSRG